MLEWIVANSDLIITAAASLITGASPLVILCGSIAKKLSKEKIGRKELVQVLNNSSVGNEIFKKEAIESGLQFAVTHIEKLLPKK